MSVESNAEPGDNVSAYSRRGEKIGWIGGWTGGFLWILILAVIKLFEGDMAGGALGILVFLIAEALIIGFAPWRFPTTRYIVLMLPVYALFLLSSCWAVWTLGGLGQSEFNYWSLFLILPVLSPLFTTGGRRWQDWDPEKMRQSGDK